MKPRSLQKLVLVLALSWCVSAYICPSSSNCNCGGIVDSEISCKIDGVQVILNILPEVYFNIDCNGMETLDYTKLPKINTIQNKVVKTVTFKECPTPSLSFGEVLSHLGLAKVHSFVFQNRRNLSDVLSRNHMKGLEEVTRLAISTPSNNLADDVLDDMVNVFWLNLKSGHFNLTPGSFKTLTKLQTLELSNNHITEIPDNTFANLKSLKQLLLWQNECKFISPNVFNGTENLEKLDLSSNSLETFSASTFAPLKHLKEINLYSNNFKSLPSDLFANNRELVRIKLFNNNRKLKVLPDYLLSNLPLLQEAYLYRLDLHDVPENVFGNSSNLLNISLAYNDIEVLPEKLFQDQKNLMTLDLSYNKIKNLSENLFSGLWQLEYLNLENNQLETLVPGIFDSLHNLVYLNLDHNKLSTIQNNLFNSNIKISELSAAHNQIDFGSVDVYDDAFGVAYHSPFNNLVGLKVLNLSHNRIRLIYNDWRTTTVKLESLDLSYNSIEHLVYADFNFLSNNLTVDLRHNSIASILFRDAEAAVAHQNIPDAYHSRTAPSRNVKFFISDNPFQCDCLMTWFVLYLTDKLDPKVHASVDVIPGDATCSSPENLKGTLVSKLQPQYLLCPLDTPDSNDTKQCPEGCNCHVRILDKAVITDCAMSGIKEVPVVPNVTSLQLDYAELHLENNWISELKPHGAIPDYVTKLYLNGNNLTKFEPNDIPKDIELLDVRNNSISRLDEAAAGALVNGSRLQKAWLSGNPIACDCDNLIFLSLLKEKYDKIQDFNELQCHSDKTKISLLNVGSLCGTTPAIIALSTLVALAGLIVGAAAALYYKYSQEIKVYLFSKGWCLWWVTEDEIDKDKQFDAFVSFSFKDEDFVVNKLVSELEKGPNPFKLCVHFRDWVAGELIPAQIARSVADSRRTIVVLSPDFLKSVWGKMEFRAAHCQALREGRARVIVIIYGDIGPTDNLDPELQSYLTTNTYVKWGDPWFWDKLRYALPHANRRKNHVSSNLNITKKKGFDDRLELINPATPTTPPGQNTPPCHQAHTNPLMSHVNPVPNGALKQALNANAAITMNGLKVNSNAKHSDV